MHLRWALGALLLFSLSCSGAPLLSQSTSGSKEQLAEHIRLSQQYLRAQRPDLALPELKAVVALDPRNVEARGNLGVLLYFRGDYAEAVPQLRAALALKPGLWKIQALLGMSEQHLGNGKDARIDLESSFPHLSNEKIKMEVGNSLIAAYTATRDLDKAAATASALLKLEPTNTELLYTAYSLYSDLADQAVLTVAMTAPASAQMHQMIARVLQREGDSAGAIANYREAIRLNPKDPDLHFQLAELLDSSGTVEDRKQAVDEFKAALALDPSDERSYAELGRIALRSGDSQSALENYSKAVKLTPGDSVAQLGLARALLAMQQPEKALPALERAVQLDPTNATAHFRLSTLYRSMGKEAEAKKQLDEYLKYKKMREQLSALLKKMRVPQADQRAPND